MYDDIILLRLQQRFRLELLNNINVLLIIQGQVLLHTFLSMLKEYLHLPSMNFPSYSYENLSLIHSP